METGTRSKRPLAFNAITLQDQRQARSENQPTAVGGLDHLFSMCSSTDFFENPEMFHRLSIFLKSRKL
jgi:hypothetical protein